MAVVEQKSFSRAAKSLNLTQPAVSKHLHLLEEYYGLPLLIRGRQEVEPTSAGKVLYRYAKEVLRTLAKAREELTVKACFLQGELLLGASTIPGEYVLPSRVSSFQKAYPGVQVFLKITNTAGVVQELQQRKISLGAIGAPVAGTRLAAKKLAEDKLKLIVPPYHPFALRGEAELAELRNEKFVWREKGSGTRQVVEARLAQAGLPWEKLKIVAEMGSTEAVIRAVEAGLGLAFVSERAAAREEARGKIAGVDLKRISLARDLYLIYLAKQPLSAVAATFLDFASQPEGKDQPQP